MGKGPESVTCIVIQWHFQELINFAGEAQIQCNDGESFKGLFVWDPWVVWRKGRGTTHLIPVNDVWLVFFRYFSSSFPFYNIPILLSCFPPSPLGVGFPHTPQHYHYTEFGLPLSTITPHQQQLPLSTITTNNLRHQTSTNFISKPPRKPPK